MIIFDKEKLNKLDNPDLDKGYLIDDVITIHHKKVRGRKEKFHYETVKEYPNGGKDIVKVIDVKGTPYKPAYDEELRIKVYIPYSEKEIEDREKNALRKLREEQCFNIINKGTLWYNSLSEEQLKELTCWYKAWLDVTATKFVPITPDFV